MNAGELPERQLCAASECGVCDLRRVELEPGMQAGWPYNRLGLWFATVTFTV